MSNGRYAFLSRIEGREHERGTASELVIVDLSDGTKHIARAPEGWRTRNVRYLSEEEVVFAAVRSDNWSEERIFRMPLDALPTRP